MNIAKEIRFYSGKEVRDAEAVVDRVMHAKKRDHWTIYGGYFATLFLLCTGFKKVAVAGGMPVVTVEEVTEFLSKPVDEQKEYLVTASMTYMPDAVYEETYDMIQKMLKTRPKESQSCVERALEGFSAFFGEEA